MLTLTQFSVLSAMLEIGSGAVIHVAGAEVFTRFQAYSGIEGRGKTRSAFYLLMGALVDKGYLKRKPAKNRAHNQYIMTRKGALQYTETKNFYETALLPNFSLSKGSDDSNLNSRAVR